MVSRLGRGLRPARRWFDQAVVWLFPSRCFACAAPLPRVQLLGACVPCWTALAGTPRMRCRGCALPLPDRSDVFGPGRGVCARCLVQPLPFGRAVASVDYSDAARRFLLRAKDGNRRELLRPLGGQLAAAVSIAGLAEGMDAIAPVPSSLRARLRRGFNPAKELAEPLAKAVALPLVDDVLRKTGFGGPVKGLSARQRWAGVDRTVSARRTIPGLRILLVDDVLTTGATAATCADTLRAAGAIEIRVAVWARTPSTRLGFDRSRSGRL